MPTAIAIEEKQQTVEGAASCDDRIVKVQGAARTGKTETIVRRVAHLVEEGVDPADILVEASTAMACQELRQRIAGACPAAADVAVQTPLAICVRILDSAAARDFTGRSPRIVNSMERKFLLEDMRTTGMKNRKLRAKLRFFAQRWEAGEPEEKWLIDAEEEDLLAYLRGKLVRLGAMLPEEAPNLAAGFLSSDEGAGARASYRYVLCDDFQNMSHMQQTVCCLLVSQQLIVAGNANETVAVSSDCPNPEGFAEFDRVRHGVTTMILGHAHGNPRVQRFANALCAQGDMDAASAAEAFDGEPEAASHPYEQGVIAVKWPTPEDEFNGVTKYLRALMDKRPADGRYRAYVVVPNRRWAKTAEKVCRQRGFKVSAAGAVTGIKGDPRDARKSRAMQAYVKLNLLANPEDLMAWRCWCGFGDYLMGSNAWHNLEEYANKQELPLADALRATAEAQEEPFLAAKLLQQGVRSGSDFLNKNRGRRGFALLKAIGAQGLPEFEALSNRIAGDETAQHLYLLMRDAVDDPVYPEEDIDLRITTPDRLCGLSADALFVLGAVDGFYPDRDAFEVVSTDEARAARMDGDRRALYSAVAKAGGLLVVSYFEKMGLELAERAKVQVARVRSEHGERVALVRPSCFLGETGAAYPGTVSGQQLLASYNLD